MNMKTIMTSGFALAYSFSAFALMDITEFLRTASVKAGVACYVAEANSNTRVLTSDGNFGVTNAFDGVTSSTDHKYRCLLQNETASVPSGITYAIPASAVPDYDFRIGAIRIYPLTGDSFATSRSVSGFRLEGRNGEQTWQTIFETEEPEPWESNTSPRTYYIPVSNRKCYRQYRFTATHAEAADWCGFEELQFLGDIERRLVWNGADGARWNATDKNWVDASGTATNWIPGAKAIFGRQGSSCIQVEGTNDVCGIEFTAPTACTIEGGALAMARPAVILPGGGGDVLASEMVDVRPVDQYNGRDLFPAASSSGTQGAWTLLWRNRKLSGITNFTGGVILQYGNTRRAANPYHFVRDGDNASVQFQSSYVDGDARITLCAKVLLAQNCADVHGKVAYTAFTFANDSLGRDFDISFEGRNSYLVYDGKLTTNGYGFYGITPEGGEFSAEPVRIPVTQSTESYGADGSRYLPTRASDTKTGDAVLCFPGCKVRDMKSICRGVLAGSSAASSTSQHFFKNDGTTASVQFQGNVSDSGQGEGYGARVCVKVEFTDGEEGVYARAVYADYDWSNAYAHDFDLKSGHGANIFSATYTASPSYGVMKIEAVFRSGERITFGASSIVLDREILGDSQIRLAPLSGTQTVTVPETRTVENVAFGGVTAFSFLPGASFLAGSAEVEEGASVSLSSTQSGNFLMRLGTEKCFSAGQLAHFSVNGVGARQDGEGWIQPKEGLRVIFR